jgi:hypothetical protein
MSADTIRPDTFVPACDGTENVFVINGRSWLYAYHPYSGRHCYLDVDNKKPIWNRSFHPSFHPDLEHDTDPADAIAYPSREGSDEVEDFYW